jgi:hypothetical protein
MNATLLLQKKAGFFFILLGLFAMSAVTTAKADSHVSAGISLGFRLPQGAVEVSVGKDRYYVHRGVYYRLGPRGYQVVRAPRGVIVRELPSRYVRLHVGNRIYYRYGDVYYERVPTGYVVVEPPATVVQTVPAPADEVMQVVRTGDKEYTFRDGQFFQQTPEGLVWVEAPLGAITAKLPADARSVWFQEVEYFECDDVYFRKTPEGFKVVTAPWKK